VLIRPARVIMAGMNLEAIQTAIREAGRDGWLFYDHHHRDRIAGLFPTQAEALAAL